MCQMTMFHVEQSLLSHPEALWEKVNYSRRVEVVGCSVSDDNVPRGTLTPKSSQNAVGKENHSRRFKYLAE